MFKIQNKIRLLLVFVALLSFVCGLFTINGIQAYLTDSGSVLENNFTIALDVSHVVVEKFPPPNDAGLSQTYPNINGNTASFEKAVQIANTGYVDAYIRVRLDFTDSDVMRKTKFSSDNQNFYTADPNGAAGSRYIDHLPDGWVYDMSDGFFYYTKLVEAGDWEEIEKELLFDVSQYRYFYKENNELIESPIITVPLIRYVSSAFADPKDMRTYGINVIAQSCPFYTGNDYADAWTNYDPNDYL